jgi:hypothetical protein
VAGAVNVQKTLRAKCRSGQTDSEYFSRTTTAAPLIGDNCGNYPQKIAVDEFVELLEHASQGSKNASLKGQDEPR